MAVRPAPRRRRPSCWPTASPGSSRRKPTSPARVPDDLRFGGSDGRFTVLAADGAAVVVADGTHAGSVVDLDDGAASVLGGGGSAHGRHRRERAQHRHRRHDRRTDRRRLTPARRLPALPRSSTATAPRGCSPRAMRPSASTPTAASAIAPTSTPTRPACSSSTAGPFAQGSDALVQLDGDRDAPGGRGARRRAIGRPADRRSVGGGERDADHARRRPRRRRAGTRRRAVARRVVRARLVGHRRRRLRRRR